LGVCRNPASSGHFTNNTHIYLARVPAVETIRSKNLPTKKKLNRFAERSSSTVLLAEELLKEVHFAESSMINGWTYNETWIVEHGGQFGGAPSAVESRIP
jgi:hypothetical protein